MNLLRYSRRFLSGRPLIMGTLILTATGFITRIIGFFYRIYLSRLFGEEGMGVYQLLSPILALTFSLCAAAYQTAISKYVAEFSQDPAKRLQPLLSGLALSAPLSFLCLILLYLQADFIAENLLLEPRCASMIRILAFSIPLSSVHSCINGYFYGLKKTTPAALAQLMEQLSRVGCVWLISSRFLANGIPPSINIAVFGLLIGELVSLCISLGAIFLERYRNREAVKGFLPGSFSTGLLLKMALPLTLNRIVLNLLQSVEAVSIPARLKVYGYDSSAALSVYGVLTGMAMPLIFFPNALTGSISVLLLPLISENHAASNEAAVKGAIRKTIRFCLSMGIGFMILFFLIGNYVGVQIFHSPLAGHFIRTLSFLCPFLYLDTTLSSILQGLGRAGTIFMMNVIALMIRLTFVFYAIPLFGITGYLWGILLSQILLSLLYLFCLRAFLK